MTVPDSFPSSPVPLCPCGAAAAPNDELCRKCRRRVRRMRSEAAAYRRSVRSGRS